MHQIDPVLSETFFFDAVDVAANRSGRLSPDQEQGFRATISRRALPRLQVKMVEGTPGEYWNTTSDIHYLVVGGVRFPMMWDDLAKFRPERTYRVYFTEVRNRSHLLSVEVVR